MTLREYILSKGATSASYETQDGTVWRVTPDDSWAGVKIIRTFTIHTREYVALENGDYAWISSDDFEDPPATAAGR